MPNSENSQIQYESARKYLPLQILDEAARRNLLDYAQEIDPAFRLSPHLNKIAALLDKVHRGDIRRLIVNMPPRFGKSQLITRIFPTWFLGHNPAAQIIIASFGASLAKDFTRWQRNRVEAERFKQIFPKLSIRDDSRAVERWETMQGGVVIGAGIGGPLTGRGADLAVIDDPVKNYEEALSPVIQETIWDWYQSTLRTRLHPGGRIVIVMTRWVKNDLTGRLLDREGDAVDGGKWTVLKLPAIDPDGNVLWAERFSKDEVLEVKEGTTDRIWSAMYQQEPIDVIEQIFKDPMYEEGPSHKRTFAYLDPAFGGADYSALTIGFKMDDLIYITGGWIWQGEVDKTYDLVTSYCQKYKVSVLYCESNQAQRILTYEFAKRGLAVKERDSIRNKHLRIVDWAKKNWAKVRFSHNVTDAYMRQVLDYSELAPHDDAPDSLAGLINELNGAQAGSILLSGKRTFSDSAF